MKILAIESSAGPASCVVLEDGQILASSVIHTGLTHSQTLIPMVDAMLRNAGIAFSSIDLLAAAAGPGSFTGIRIGVAAVKGLAFAQDKPCIGVSTLAAMARTVQGLPFTGTVCPVMDARCHQVYTALFDCSEGKFTRMTEDQAISITDLGEKLVNLKKTVLFIGDGAEICYNMLASRVPGVRLAPAHLRYQNAAGVAMEAAASAEQAVSAAELMPVYLRLPQAERELKQRRGLI